MLAAAAVSRRIREREIPPSVRAADLIEEFHRRALDALPWCGPVDDNPSNVMAAADGSLRITDPYYADGPALYEAVLTRPLEVARSIPPALRRHMLQIPLASSGGWDPVVRDRMQAALDRADEELGWEGPAG